MGAEWEIRFHWYSNIFTKGNPANCLFNLKDNNQHESNVVYRAEYTCNETYIDKTKRNFTLRKDEHENT